MSYLVGGSQEQLNYFAGQTAVLPLDEQSRAADLRAHRAGQREVAAARRSEAARPGRHRRRAAGELSRSGRADGACGVDRGFSVNLAPEQTQLDRLEEKQVVELFGPFKPHLAHSRDQIDRSVSMARVGRELYPPLIFLVALVLAVECLMANRFYKE